MIAIDIWLEWLIDYNSGAKARDHPYKNEATIMQLREFESRWNSSAKITKINGRVEISLIMRKMN